MLKPKLERGPAPRACGAHFTPNFAFLPAAGARGPHSMSIGWTTQCREVTGDSHRTEWASTSPLVFLKLTGAPRRTERQSEKFSVKRRISEYSFPFPSDCPDRPGKRRGPKCEPRAWLQPPPPPPLHRRAFVFSDSVFFLLT